MKFTDHLMHMKNSFIPMYGVNRHKKFAKHGRRLLRDEEVIVFDKASLVTKDYILTAPKTEEVRCIDEVANLIECLIANEYDSTNCAKEVLSAKRCKERELASNRKKREMYKSKALPADSNDLNLSQINELLKTHKIKLNKTH